MREKFKTASITLIVTIFSIMLVYIKKNPIANIDFIANKALNSEINYQVTVLILSISMIVIVIIMTGMRSLKFLNITRLDGVIKPDKYIGIKPNHKDTWLSLGINFSIIISTVTAIVIYFQVYQNQEMNFILFPNLFIILILALSNSFVEEIIFRFSFVSIINYNNQSQYLAQALSALTFGIIHYFGVPAGIPGVLMAGFIGWFLTKSIFETKGFFWAWFIHFVQDVIIMIGLFMMI